jgi:hypothetical protein
MQRTLLQGQRAAFPEITGKRMLGALYSAFMDPRCSQDVTDLLKEGLRGASAWPFGRLLEERVEIKEALCTRTRTGTSCCQ